jgi:hypothetical protein
MNLVERVKGIILTPKTEWPIIAGEPGDVGTLFGGYVAILAAIPAVCGFIGAVLGGAPVVAALIGSVIKYLLTFVAIYVIAWIIDMLAPTFSSSKNFANALKLTVYSYTPSWLCGIFLLIPGLRFLTILGLYGLYLLWLGLPPLMKTPPDKTIGYTIAIIVCALIIAILIGLLVGGLIGIRGFM